MAAKNGEICLALLRCETEDDVIRVLQHNGFWDDRASWRPYGDICNNRGIVGNQQSSAVAALVEKLVNSIDAVLIGECLRRGIDPAEPDAPQSMEVATQRFFDMRRGRLQTLDAGSRTRLAEHIHLVACGTKEEPAYVIVDDGEGQAPDQFPDTFLSLLRENKTAIPFVQGKFNMGGTGVLQFAGAHSFQLVISKRQPGLPTRPSERASHWGFTLLRRLDPDASHPYTMYVYLAPGGRVPSFQADELPLLPGRYPQGYAEPLQAGTCIKLWNYKVPGRLKSLATLDLRYALERHLQDPALPIRIHERRQGYRGHSFDTTMSGLCSVLADERGSIEPGFDTGSPMEIQDIGRVQLRLVVLKESETKDHATAERYAGGIFFDVNGQLHSELGSDFISRRTKYDYIAGGTIVIVDCSELPQRVREDLFLASRDRMRQCQEKRLLEDAVADYLKDHQGLRELNARRRQARLASQSQEDTTEVIQELVRADPTLALLFGRGDRVRIPVGPIPQPVPYAGRSFPTFFRLAKEPRGGLLKTCPLNRTCRVEFETDATNDYFSRSADPGRLEIHGAPCRVGSVHLWNGRSVLRFTPPASSTPGDRLNVQVLVSDISRVDPFESRFAMEVEPEAPPAPPGATGLPPGASFSGLPNIIEVHQDEWGLHGFDQLAALKLSHGDGDVLDLFINMDNIHLRNEIAKRRNVDPGVLKHWFKYGLCLLALGMIFDRRQTRPPDAEEANGDADEAEYHNRVAEVCRGLAVTVIPVIAQLGQARD